jgi:hypothetical protein
MMRMTVLRTVMNIIQLRDGFGILQHAYRDSEVVD